MHPIPTSSRLALLAACLLLHPSSFILAQGSLTPPGAPAPTMKTLDQIEPRVAINATNTPGDADSLFKITQPGSYYLTGNITGVSGKDGIEIAASDVTLDLMGFELAGVSGALFGIAATVANTRSVAIRNGSVRGWGGNGIDVGSSRNNVLTELRAQGNASGIIVGSGSILTDCTAYLNTGFGIDVGSGSVLNGCTSLDNLSTGIRAGLGSTVTGCTANGNREEGISAGNGCAIKDCTAAANGIDGINSQRGGNITACATQLNGGDGIEISDGTITACMTQFNSADGIKSVRSTITGCTASNNSGNGIIDSAGSTITGCTVSLNTLNGIRIGSNSRVIDNTCNNNGASPGPFSGIYTNASGSRIEGNSVTGNGFGIFLDGAVSGNLVIRNHARGNTNNYSYFPTTGNFIGTLIVTSAAMNEATNSLVNISN